MTEKKSPTSKKKIHPNSLAALRPGVPLHLRPDHKELSAKGGRAKSVAKDITQAYQGMIEKARYRGDWDLVDILKALREKRISDALFIQIGRILSEYHNFGYGRDKATGAIVNRGSKENAYAMKILADLLPKQNPTPQQEGDNNTQYIANIQIIQGKIAKDKPTKIKRIKTEPVQEGEFKEITEENSS